MKKQNGFSINIAIFLLVIVSLIIFVLFLLVSTQKFKQIYEIIDATAYFSAKTGIEIGYFYANQSDCSSRTITLPNNFTVNITCSSNTSREQNIDYIFYNITATACNTTTCPILEQPPNYYVEKQLQSIFSSN